MLRLLLSFSLALCLLMLATASAFAQYFPETAQGYRLEAVPEHERLSVVPPHSLLIAAEECSGLVLDGLFRVESGMNRYFELSRGSGGEFPSVNEYYFNRATPVRLPPQAEAVRYEIDGRPIYIGMGTTVAPPGGYMDYVVASFLPTADGAMEELGRFTLGARHCAGIYAIELIADGVVELVCPYSTGAGGGGGIDLRAVVPTGGLAPFGDGDLDSTLWSASGYVNFADYGGTGDWQIETVAPVLCSACGYSFKDLYVFDRQRWQWRIDAARFADYYAPQQRFYRALNETVKQMAADPSKFAYNGSELEAEYAATVDGRLVSLDAFMRDGRIDRTWVQTLADLVRSWK